MTPQEQRNLNLPEFRLLLYCARSRPDARSIKDIVKKGVDWQVVLEYAARHCVRPMLLKSLKSVCWHAVPGEIKLQLTNFNKLNVRKNLIFTRELLCLLELFQSHSIPIAVFKGPILAESVYGDISLREFSDLDVIVPEADLDQAEHILTSRGYQADFADKDYRSAFLSYQGQYAFRNPRTGISIDLHWRLSSKGLALPPQLSEIWPRLEQVTIANRTVPTLGHVDLALFLAAHGTKEGWKSLLWVCDFAELLRKHQDIDWLAVFDCAQRSYFSRPLLLAFILASTLLDAPVPPELVKEARINSAVRALAENARFRMLRTVQEGELREFLNGLNTHSRLSHRLRPFLTLLTTRTVSDYQTMPLPKSLWGIYYFTRPFRLVIKGLAMMLSANKLI